MLKNIPGVRSVTILLILFCIFLLFFRPIETGDVWWHLATGKWIAEHKSVPANDIFCPLSIPRDGVSTQWLGSTIYYIVYQYFGGLNTLKVFRALLFVFITLMTIIFFHRRVPFWILIAGLFFLTQGLLTRFDLRPYIFNFLLIQLLLQLCLLFEEKDNWRYLIPVPFIGIVWCNIHLGSLIYGVPILGAFTLGALLKCAPRKYDRPRREPDFPKTFNHFKTFTIILLLYIAGFLLNPYGITGFLYPFRVFLDPNFISFYKLGAVIVELQPPKFILTASGWWVHLLCIFSLLALVFDKKRRFALVILFLFATFFYLRYARTGPFFVLISIYTIFDSASRIFSDREWKLPFKTKTTVQVIVYALVLFLCIGKTVHWVTQKTLIRQKESFCVLQLLEPNNPQAALEFLCDHKLDGLIFNSSSYGGYLIGAAYPKIKPFADNRQYDFEIYQNYLSILSNPQRYWPAAQKDLNFKTVLIDANHGASRALMAYLHKRPDWKLVFFEGASAIFVRADLPALTQQKISPLEPVLSNVTLTLKEYKTLQEAAEGARRFRASGFPPYVYIQDFQEGMVLLTDLGYSDAGAKKILAALPYLDPNYARHVASAVLELLRER